MCLGGGAAEHRDGTADGRPLLLASRSAYGPQLRPPWPGSNTAAELSWVWYPPLPIARGRRLCWRCRRWEHPTPVSREQAVLEMLVIRASNAGGGLRCCTGLPLGTFTVHIRCYFLKELNPVDTTAKRASIPGTMTWTVIVEPWSY